MMLAVDYGETLHGENPQKMARRMASYRTDAPYIRAMVLREHGQAPDLSVIQSMIDRRIAERAKAYIEPEPEEAEAPVPAMVKPAPIARPTKHSAPWPAWYTPPGANHGGDRMPALQLVMCVAADFGLSVADVKGRGRSTQFVNARCVITKILRDRGHSYPVIGRMIGNRDHSTVMNLYRRFDFYCLRDPLVSESYGARRDRIGANG